MSTRCLETASSLVEAVNHADIIQEQGPEKINFKQRTWSEIETLALLDALFWSSTSGIPASVQSKRMKDKGRLTIVHLYNPPHIMPLLEIVHSTAAEHWASSYIWQTLNYWEKFGRKPVVLQEEIAGFVPNYLAFALFEKQPTLLREESRVPSTLITSSSRVWDPDGRSGFHSGITTPAVVKSAGWQGFWTRLEIPSKHAGMTSAISSSDTPRMGLKIIQACRPEYVSKLRRLMGDLKLRP